jgi:glycyl-tRNA synthetase beta chain
MPDFFLELFSEEIPARMQARAAEDLGRLFAEALAALKPRGMETFYGTRRIALACTLDGSVPESRISERGPRANAPEQALAGFLRKHGASKDDLLQEGDFWVLNRVVPGATAAELIARSLPSLIRRFPWPKSMRWGGTSPFTWVRPLRRITAILDGAVVHFDLRDGDDHAHGLKSANISEGHRFLSHGHFTVHSVAQWKEELRKRHVIVDAAERRSLVEAGVKALAAEQGCTIAEDPGLLDEVAGLVEWPVCLLGRIDDAYMDLPAEVMQVSMRVNQRYFALRNADGSAAPWFAFAANIHAKDGGGAIIAGNERVLRARFADARHFWDLDRHQALSSRVEALDRITFQAKLGSQGARVRRIEQLAQQIAPLVGAEPDLASRAAYLAKADLTTGMVGEFPELQGVMGGYYARHDGENPQVAEAVRDHYLPKGAGDAVPTAPVSIAVALADKIDILAAFFAIGEKPTGSGDPYALRRAALGVIRILRENGLRLSLGRLFHAAIDIRADQSEAPAERPHASPVVAELLDFLAERLRIQLRSEGARHDVLAAVLSQGIDDDLVRLLARTDAVADFIGTDDGANLLAAAKRAANILRIEEKKDGPHDGPVHSALLNLSEEQSLHAALDKAEPAVRDALQRENFRQAMTGLAGLRAPLDAFFASVTVNDELPDLRHNRLRLLALVRAAMNLAADFSKIDG